MHGTTFTMKRTVMSITFMVCIVAGVLFFVYLAAVKMQEKTLPNTLRVEGMWTMCEPAIRDRLTWISCWRQALPALISRYGLSTVLNSAEEHYNAEDNAELGGISRCHDFAHLAGEVAIRQLKSTKNVFSQCTPMCGYGCYMGVVDGSLKPDFFESEYKQICSTSPEPYPCIHALGHAIGNRFGSVLKGQQYCAGFGEDEARQHCMSGLLMERFEASSFGHESDLIPEDIVSFCTALDPGVRNVCYWRSGMLTYWRTKSYRTAIQICDDIPAFERLGCISVLGQEMYYELKADAKKILDFCSYFPDQDDGWQCIEGALKKSVISDALLRHGEAICNEVPPTKTDTCRTFLHEFKASRP